MSENWILYQTTNLVNGKIYVGVHKLADNYRSRNYLGSGLALRPAIKKYGKENFTRVTLEEFSCAEDAYAAEALVVTENFVKREDTYNLKIGGEGGIFTEEIKAKMSAAAKKRKATPETKAKISAAHKGNTYNIGRKLSEEHRAKIVTALEGRVKSVETRLKLSIAQTGKKYSEKSKEKMRESAKGRILDEETKIRVSISKGKPVVIDGRFHTALNQAAKFNKIADGTVRRRVESCKPKWISWRYAVEEEIANFLRGGALEE